MVNLKSTVELYGNNSKIETALSAMSLIFINENDMCCWKSIFRFALSHPHFDVRIYYLTLL